MHKWITFPHREGTCSRQAHADFPEQAIYEREAGRSGFFGPAAHFHHQHAPTGWSEWEGELRPRAFNFNHVQRSHALSPWQVPLLLHNHEVKVRVWKLEQAMPALARNADGDELLFIHQGKADLYCDYGHMVVSDGDYVLIPRSTNWRLEPIEPLFILMIENTDAAYALPEKGLVGNHAVFDPAVLDVPSINDQFRAQYSEQQTQVQVKRHGQLSTITFPFNPLDAVGWHGDLSVVRLNWRDIRPLMSHRYHLPPSAHTTFVGQGFVVCTFVPRPIESDPGALKVPFYHNNDDYDEVLFYHAGDFFSRDNIEAGMVTFHPAGFTHGPHPKAFQAGLEYRKKFTDEVAVMIDTRHALQFSDAAQQVENRQYVYSWQSKKE
ncbi:TPA: homogentisate 1,2-dioxygenase [Vibrio cholerae]|uniref:homogentisate 1,2-dioxygenase n=1 Tax=Vibrio cholerae TaxID=666 RepID=UPI0015830EA4|nr:homogentisate 1,2-dioxygenase [Vibrio cholerae]EJY0882249.1 homogentisate 1,2-dioxygenase [Vibrio cholerae]ELH0899877.1 homogentisate 1,2-dioxygenase [Vibrio cholerae]ELH5152129.1 homogentisate 1,2-dioxygenase [Vibrio cholerae]QKU59547.1 homogentisate 1,2-dioxygenase [Vibrio cholerae]QKU63186.1 homogentisate 1,2-dioxygenase [Vibrio cholerae]